MEMLATVFQGLLDLGAAVFLPIVLFIIGRNTDRKRHV